MRLSLQILPIDLLDAFLASFDPASEQHFNALHESEISAGNFSFYTSVSAVFSSKIEGEDIELDSFIKHKKLGVAYQPDYTRKIDDLYNAYLFAQQNPITPENIGSAHTGLTRNILRAHQQGQFRQGNMFVLTKQGRIEYVAASPDLVSDAMERLYADIAALLEAELSFSQVFFFAALIHLFFVKIHPFDDGNGRTARLLEKWFLAEKLGAKAWFMQSEQYYYDHQPTYYQHLRLLGLEYDELDYALALPFLQMLPEALRTHT